MRLSEQEVSMKVRHKAELAGAIEGTELFALIGKRQGAEIEEFNTNKQLQARNYATDPGQAMVGTASDAAAGAFGSQQAQIEILSMIKDAVQEMVAKMDNPPRR
jgi:hypothetical protein